jgi:hypothetical protein
MIITRFVPRVIAHLFDMVTQAELIYSQLWLDRHFTRLLWRYRILRVLGYLSGFGLATWVSLTETRASMAVLVLCAYAFARAHLAWSGDAFGVVRDLLETLYRVSIAVILYGTFALAFWAGESIAGPLMGLAATLTVVWAYVEFVTLLGNLFVVPRVPRKEEDSW